MRLIGNNRDKQVEQQVDLYSIFACRQRMTGSRQSDHAVWGKSTDYFKKFM